VNGFEAIESAIIDEFAGRITRQQAIKRVQSVLDVTDDGATDLLDHPVAARDRYAIPVSPEHCDRRS
jgi:hypothetical protein